MRIIKICFALALLATIMSCSSSRIVTNASQVSSSGVSSLGILMSVSPERNGGAPDALELTIHNNTQNAIQFGAGYSIERLVDGKWENHELGNFAVIAIMYGLAAGESGQYTINLFNDRVSYPAGDYRVVKQINVGDANSQPYYANFRIIEPR